MCFLCLCILKVRLGNVINNRLIDWQVPAQFAFIAKLDDKEYCKRWLTVKPHMGIIAIGNISMCQFTQLLSLFINNENRRLKLKLQYTILPPQDSKWIGLSQSCFWVVLHSLFLVMWQEAPDMFVWLWMLIKSRQEPWILATRNLKIFLFFTWKVEKTFLYPWNSQIYNLLCSTLWTNDMLQRKDCVMSAKSVYIGTDHYFLGGWLGFFQTKFLHSKTAERKFV